MTTDSTRSPVTRETSAYVRDKGLRPVMATLTGGVLVMRAKGLRSREILDLGWCYSQAVKQRVAQERAEKRAARGNAKRSQRGSATWALIGLVLLIAGVLAIGGPAMDAPSYGSGATPDAEIDAATQIEAARRLACGLDVDDNASTRLDAQGRLVCTDKHGRPLPARSQITTARKVAAP